MEESPPLIPRATTAVPGFVRLRPPPPAPSGRIAAAKLSPTPKVPRAAEPARIPKAKASVPAKLPSAPAKIPSAPAKASSVPVKAIPKIPTPPKGPPPKVPAPPRGPPSISSDSFGDGTLLLSPITNRKCRLEGEARDSVKRVLLLDFHNTLDRYFTPGRKQQHAIPWPSTRPTLLPEVTDFVKHCVTAASQNESFTCVVVLSLIHKSQESEAWLRDTIHNTLEEVGEIGDTERCLFDLLIVSRERIGPKGKLSVAFCNKRRAARRVVHAFLGAILPRAFSLATASCRQQSDSGIDCLHRQDELY